MLTKLHSFISSSRASFDEAVRVKPKTKTSAFIMMKAVLFIAVFFLLEGQLADILDPGRYKSNFHPRLRWEEFYGMKQNIDVAFLGSSHAYRSFDPTFFDRELNVTSFNFGHSDQNPIDSYYVLNEVLRFHHPKLIVLELFFPLSEGVEANQISASYFLSASYVYDYLKPSMNKWACFFDEFQPKDYLKAFFHTVRDKDNYKNMKLIKENLNRKAVAIHDWLTRKEVPATMPTATSLGEIYKGRGYVVNDGVASPKKLQETNRLKVYQGLPNWDEKKLRYIDKIAGLAKEKGIPIVFVTSPLPPSTMKFLKRYEDIHNKYQEIADRNGVQYLDYNYMKGKNVLFTDKNFKDEDHLNSSGVKIFNQDLLPLLRPYFNP
ncbi:hypothetical protein O9H85_31965 [Paenibacillus filicis]|uniref:SGNH/GDSL hydrolase family protein n=1 Tax=Paenibacillus gyeongsangnamensis TaxID=3388067 RepID=A0ABT4QJ47_9BACL|nr:hypothetical protein [Paenibacillus filicis]MCZ8516894.1 hypothetical protein [Paenibacillus filicis]